MYTFNQVYKETLSYFGGDTLAANVWISKYCLKDNKGSLYELSPLDMHKRLASEFSRVESRYPNALNEQEIFELFDRFKYVIPQGSPMAGIGNNFLITSLSNCFVVTNPHDSYAGIMKTEQQLISIMKRRGGVGLSIHSLRPKDMPTTSVSEKSSGVVLFSERYSRATREVAQDGRRGALMISCRIDHPDAVSFIEAKTDLQKITGANVSVMITDKFMDAVKHGTEYEVSFTSSKGEVRYNLDAKKVWDKIILNAWKSAEPGILFWDNILRESPADCYAEYGFETTSTNPCFTGDTLVAVADGRGDVTLKELAEQGLDVPVYCMNHVGELKVRTMRNPRITGYKQKIYRVKLDNGKDFNCTANHKFYLKGGQVKEAINLQAGDSLQILSKVKDTAYNRKFTGLICNGWGEAEHRFLYEEFSGESVKGYDVHHIDGDSFNNSFDNLQRLTKGEHNIIHEKAYSSESNPNFSGISNEDLYSKFLYITKEKGRKLSKNEYYEFGGIVWNEYRKVLAPTLSVFLEKLAIESFTDINLVNGDPRVIRRYQNAIREGYEVKVEGSLVFVKKTCEFCGEDFWVKHTRREQSFCGQECALNHTNLVRWNFKKESVESEFYNHKVISVEYIGEADVYNGTVDEFHNFFAGGFKSKTRKGQDRLTYCLTAQCGEIPLCPGDSCRLMALNLYSYVKEPFTSNARFDFTLFKAHVNKAQRLMDSMIDLEIEKIKLVLEKVKNDDDPEDLKSVELELWQKIELMAINGRRTGLGVTAEGDMLAALGLIYGTVDATNFSEQVHKIMAIESYKASIEMGRERGCFPIWSQEKEAANPFIKRILNELGNNSQYFQDYIKTGRRNIANLTIAPTGTVSLMAQTTSGIEPCFLPVYSRRRKINDPDKATFKDEVGDLWEEYNVFHHHFLTWFSLNWKQVLAEVVEVVPEVMPNIETMEQSLVKKIVGRSPYYKATANDVDWVEKVRMQGKVQRWVDHSISVTVNVPNETPVEVVEKIYMTAYDSGCKGCTIYRDGSRSGVLVSDKKEKPKIVYNDAPKRPKEMECDIYHKTALGRDFTVLVGLLDGKPYEIFAFEQINNNDFPKDIKSGYICKVRSQHYRLSGIKNEKEYVIENIIPLMGDDEATNTRKYSIQLRHGIKPLFISMQIEKYASVTSFDKVVSRVLKNYTNGQHVNEMCPNCSYDHLVMQDGCVSCPNCGYSKC